MSDEFLEAAIEEALKSTPEFLDLGQHLMVDMTPEGLRIQIVDREGRSVI